MILTNVYILVLIIFTPPLGTNAVQGYTIFPSEAACKQELAASRKRLGDGGTTHNAVLHCINVGSST